MFTSILQFRCPSNDEIKSVRRAMRRKFGAPILPFETKTEVDNTCRVISFSVICKFERLRSYQVDELAFLLCKISAYMSSNTFTKHSYKDSADVFTYKITWYINPDVAASSRQKAKNFVHLP